MPNELRLFFCVHYARLLIRAGDVHNVLPFARVMNLDPEMVRTFAMNAEVSCEQTRVRLAIEQRQRRELTE